MDLGKKNNIIFIVFCIVISVLLFNGFRLIEKQNTWNYFYNYYYLLKQDHAILKNSIVTYEDLVDKSKIGLMENKNKFDFIVPQKLDIPSMLIFLEEYALLNDVTVSEINLLEEDNENYTYFGITYKPILVEAIGSYDNILHFLSDVQNNMGVVNFIDNVSFKGTNRNLIEWNKNSQDSEKIIVNFKLYIGYNGREVQKIE